jgi:ABC-2 type transport system permease protein
MAYRPSAALVRQEVRLIRREPDLFLVFGVLPLVIVGFVRPLVAPVLRAAGDPSANGTEQAVPAMIVLFGLVLVGHSALSFLREHGWNTWQRLRSSPASSTAILVGKGAPFALLLLVQQVVLIGGSTLLFDFRIRGSIWAVLAVCLAFTLSLVPLSFLVVAVSRSAKDVNLFTNLGAMALSGLGGALTPVSALPDWIRTLAPCLPTYWAVSGLRQAIDGSGSHGRLILCVAVLAAFGAVFTALALARFRFEDAKRLR